MNNFSQRLFFAVIGVLIVIMIISNHWLNKQIVSPPSPPVFATEEPSAPEPVSVEQKDYDVFSDYPTVPTGNGLKQEVFETKKPERTFSKKITYEMPTSNKFLLQ